MLAQHQQDKCTDRIFKLNPIHASVILRFPEFAEFSESSALFRKNSSILRKTRTRAHYKGKAIVDIDLNNCDKIT